MTPSQHFTAAILHFSAAISILAAIRPLPAIRRLPRPAPVPRDFELLLSPAVGRVSDPVTDTEARTVRP